MNTHKLAMFAVCLQLIFIVAGCSKAKKEIASDRQTMTVDVAHPTVDSLVIRQTFPAYLEAGNKVEVVARVNGYITGKHFTDGQTVKRGQLLFTIEDSQYRDAVAQAEAALASARSQTDYATRQYEAMKKALESDAVSKMDVVQAENAMNAGQASIKNAQAELQTARTNLGYCRITALADGHIESPNINVGDYVGGAGAPVTLTTIYDDSSLNAVFSVTDDVYLRMLENFGRENAVYKSIPLDFSQELPRPYTGYLSYIAPDIDRSTGTMTIKLTVDNPEGDLKSGMYARIHLPVATDAHAILVKDASIGSDQKGKYLYLVNDSSRVVYTPIEVGDLYQDTLRIVTSGVTPADRYVTKALLKVRNGMPVKVDDTDL